MGKFDSFLSRVRSKRESDSDSADPASCDGMSWLMSWKNPSCEAEERIRSLSFGSEREITDGDRVDGERLVGRDRAGGRRRRSRERASAVVAEEARWWFGCVEGVGGGAAVVAYMFGGYSCWLRAEDAMKLKFEKQSSKPTIKDDGLTEHPEV